jgi:hypothetical protein
VSGGVGSLTDRSRPLAAQARGSTLRRVACVRVLEETTIRASGPARGVNCPPGFYTDTLSQPIFRNFSCMVLELAYTTRRNGRKSSLLFSEHPPHPRRMRSQIFKTARFWAKQDRDALSVLLPASTVSNDRWISRSPLLLRPWRGTITPRAVNRKELRLLQCK